MSKRAERKYARLLDLYPEIADAPFPGFADPLAADAFAAGWEAGGRGWWRKLREDLDALREAGAGPFAEPPETLTLDEVGSSFALLAEIGALEPYAPEPVADPVVEATREPAPALSETTLSPETTTTAEPTAIEPTTLEPTSAPEPTAVEPASLPTAPVNEADPASGLYASYVSGLGDAGFLSDFNLEIVFSGFWTVEFQAAVVKAAEYLSRVVTGDLADVNGIDDVRVTVSLGVIDGMAGAVATGAPTGLRADSRLPHSADLVFETRDAFTAEAYGFLDDIALHEILHGLGFGNLWSLMNLVSTAPDGSLRYIGEKGTAAYAAAYPEIAAADPGAAYGVLVESQGGSGSAGVHWDDFTFRQEIMTSSINISNPVSAMTLAALEDLGYETVWDAADPGAVPIQPDDLLLA